MRLFVIMLFSFLPQKNIYGQSLKDFCHLFLIKKNTLTSSAEKIPEKMRFLALNEVVSGCSQKSKSSAKTHFCALEILSKSSLSFISTALKKISPKSNICHHDTTDLIYQWILKTGKNRIYQNPTLLRKQLSGSNISKNIITRAIGYAYPEIIHNKEKTKIFIGVLP